ncbi:hypothetical protein J6590_040051 [Homalodisca vitripennis]|nr:hypothetical protein J6590_040051 [Homalodisca vitripennis]
MRVRGHQRGAGAADERKHIPRDSTYQGRFTSSTTKRNDKLLDKTDWFSDHPEDFDIMIAAVVSDVTIILTILSPDNHSACCLTIREMLTNVLLKNIPDGARSRRHLSHAKHLSSNIYHIKI